jgi:linoleoyl-CoA desaturase
LTRDTVALRVKYLSSTVFFDELKRRVDLDFENSGRSSRGDRRMYIKSAAIVAWFVASYVLLVFFAANAGEGVVLAISLGLAAAGIGFAIQHDANHGGYSEHRASNKLWAMTLDALGGSSYMWCRKHNIIHHTYPNIAGIDDDIDIGPLGRLAPGQARRAFHRHQALYMWLVYAMLAFKWHFFDDFWSFIRGRVGRHRFPRPRGWDLVQMVAGKLVFAVWAIVVPLSQHSVATIVPFYVLTSMVLGFTLAIVFQLAHCVEAAHFPAARRPPDRMGNEWAAHQVETSVDFARDSRWLTWYLGGLNFQIEHHLFPKICHVHYPRIARIVEKTCADHGIEYRSHTTLFNALASHRRWLRQMGRGRDASIRER